MIESSGDFAEHQEYQRGSERLSTSSMAHIAKVFLAPRAYSHKFSGRRIFAEASTYSFTCRSLFATLVPDFRQKRYNFLRKKTQARKIFLVFFAHAADGLYVLVVECGCAMFFEGGREREKEPTFERLANTLPPRINTFAIRIPREPQGNKSPRHSHHMYIKSLR